MFNDEATATRMWDYRFGRMSAFRSLVPAVLGDVVPTGEFQFAAESGTTISDPCSLGVALKRFEVRAPAKGIRFFKID